MNMNIVAILVISMVVSGWNSLAYGTPVFGPGPHWIDTVPAATVPFQGVVSLAIDTNKDQIADMNVRFVGPTTVQLSGAIDDSNFYPGLRSVNGHLDVVDTEVLSMSMAGEGIASGSTLKAGTGSGLLERTLGTLAESTTDPAVGESFFDVYFEIDSLPLLGTVHNNAPLHIAGLTYYLPPEGFDYVVTNAPIALYDSNNLLVGYVTAGDKRIVPEPSSYALFCLGLGLFGWARKRRGRKEP